MILRNQILFVLQILSNSPRCPDGLHCGVLRPLFSFPCPVKQS